MAAREPTILLPLAIGNAKPYFDATITRKPNGSIGLNISMDRLNRGVAVLGTSDVLFSSDAASITPGPDGAGDVIIGVGGKRMASLIELKAALTIPAPASATEVAGATAGAGAAHLNLLRGTLQLNSRAPSGATADAGAPPAPSRIFAKLVERRLYAGDIQAFSVAVRAAALTTGAGEGNGGCRAVQLGINYARPWDIHWHSYVCLLRHAILSFFFLQAPLSLA